MICGLPYLFLRMGMRCRKLPWVAAWEGGCAEMLHTTAAGVDIETWIPSVE